MKRFIFASLLMVICTFRLLAQDDIQYRKILDNGKVSLKSKSVQIIENNQPPIELSLMYESIVHECDTLSGYSMVITCQTEKNLNKWYFPKNGRCLIRTASGRVITLKNIGGKDGFYVYDEQSGNHDKYYPSITLGPYVNTINGKYPISETEIAAILSEGVIKIRLETTGPAIDAIYPESEKISTDIGSITGNLFSVHLSKLFSVVNSNIDIHTDF